MATRLLAQTSVRTSAELQMQPRRLKKNSKENEEINKKIGEADEQGVRRKLEQRESAIMSNPATPASCASMR